MTADQISKQMDKLVYYTDNCSIIFMFFFFFLKIPKVFIKTFNNTPSCLVYLDLYCIGFFKLYET